MYVSRAPIQNYIARDALGTAFLASMPPPSFSHRRRCTSCSREGTNHRRDSYDAAAAAELKRKRTFRKFSYRGVDLDDLLDMSNEDFVKLVHARARRRFSRGLKRRPMALIKKLRKAKKEAQPNEKPAVVRTHMRDMIVVPEMIGSMIGVYNGKVRSHTHTLSFANARCSRPSRSSPR